MHNAGPVPSENESYDISLCAIALGRRVRQAVPMAALSDSSTTVLLLKERVLAFVRERDWELLSSALKLSNRLFLQKRVHFRMPFWLDRKVLFSTSEECFGGQIHEV
jgi:hypothetical protein